MGRRKDLSPAKISEIKTLLLNTDHSQRKIAIIAGVAKSSVDKIKKKINANAALSPMRTGKSGRKKITTPRDERKIKEICVQNRKKPRKILTNLIQESGIEISDMTVRRRLKDMGFTCCRPAKKPLLTKTMMEKRLKWAKTHKDWTSEDWLKVTTRSVDLLICFFIF